LTSVDGLFTKDPSDADAELISVINSATDSFKDFISTKKSIQGRGGMTTKSDIADRLSKVGITTHIANGKNKDIIKNICNGEKIGTTFIPDRCVSNKKRWLAYSKGFEKGTIVINEGAEKVLTDTSKVASILPIGITKASGEFEKGDVIKIVNKSKETIGIGLAEYDSEETSQVIGKRDKKALIHYDNLFLF
ncbi:MAG TPA: PUA domain-containing protein, partial [Candidatus Dojkabacteria bacterium]